jgi:plasmid segregation protein ParM
MQNVITSISKQSIQKVLCAIDHGFHSTKVYTVINGKEYKFKFDSKYERVLQDDDLNKNNTMKIYWNGYNYLVGEGASNDSLDDDKYNNELARICTYAALSKLSNFVGYEFDLVCGYPLTTCSNSKDNFVEYLKSDGVEEIELEGELKRFKIGDVNVLPQGASALYGLNTQDYKDKVVGILDVGGKTINGIVISNLNPIRQTMFTEDLGILILYNSIKMALNKEGINVMDYQVPYVMDKGLPGYGNEVGEIIDGVITKHVNDIKVIMRRNKWAIESLPILTIGGGSIVLQDALCKILPHVIRVDEPEYANVKGFYRVGELYYGY